MPTGRVARAGIGSWVAFYNDRRPHQALAYRTPMAVWRGGREPAVDMIPRHAGRELDNARALPTCPQPHHNNKRSWSIRNRKRCRLPPWETHPVASGTRTTAQIMRRSGKAKPSVWRWQERFMTDGVDGLLCDKTRPSRIPPLEQAIIDRVIALTASEPRPTGR